jgi:N6-adenosine-specific RNA methylase IME4
MITFEKSYPPSGAHVPGSSNETRLAGRLTETGWVPPPTMSFSECGAELRAIRQWHHGVLFAIGDLLNYAELKWGETYAQLASDSGYNPQFLMNCKWVAAKFPVHERVPGLSFSHHQVVASLPTAQARALLAIAGAEEWSKDDLRQTVRELRSGESNSGIRNGGSSLIDSLKDEEIVARAKEIRSSNIEQKRTHERTRQVDTVKRKSALDTSVRVPVILATPPWQEFNGRGDASIQKTEATELCQLPVSDLACADSVLFMAVPSGRIADALHVIAAWGFVYRSELVLVREKPTPGSHARVLHDLLLIAERGEMPAPEPKAKPISLIEERLGKHTTRIDQLYRIIDAMYPEFDKTQLFAGPSPSRPKNWSIWGGEESPDHPDVTKRVASLSDSTP